jgi:hypothetical protein
MLLEQTPGTLLLWTTGHATCLKYRVGEKKHYVTSPYFNMLLAKVSLLKI